MKLLALRCPECEQPLTPENEHVVTLCPHCDLAVRLADEGLARLDLHFARPEGDAPVAVWQPFWVFDGQVHITQRETQGGSRSAEQESAHLWSQPRRFYVPAWDLPLKEAQEIGSRLLYDPPSAHAGPAPRHPSLLPITVTAEDAAKLLDFIILAIEARRADWLKNLRFRLEIGPGELWAWPAGTG